MTTMKRILFLLVIISLPVLIHAQKTDTVRFVYVVQNPKFYGLDKALSWFEIEGLADKTVSQSINDSLRKAYNHVTDLEEGSESATMRSDRPTPRGYTDYYFWNGQTYGNGWIRFKDSDSLLRLTDVDGYYGSGKNIGGFSQEILEGKLAWIGIHTTRIKNDGMQYNQSINISFDLRNGKKLSAEFTVRIDPSKRPELERLLQEKAEETFHAGGYFRDAKITGSDRMTDSVIISMAQLIRWKRSEKSEYSNTICRDYEADGILTSTNQPYHWKSQACLTFDEAIPFFHKEDWRELQNL
jgi:hypothetical protein